MFDSDPDLQNLIRNLGSLSDPHPAKKISGPKTYQIFCAISEKLRDLIAKSLQTGSSEQDNVHVLAPTDMDTQKAVGPNNNETAEFFA